MVSRNYYILIDTGGTNCRIGAGFDSGNISCLTAYPSVHYSKSGAEKFSGHVSGLIERYIAEYSLNKEDCRGICIGAAGARNSAQKQEISVKLSELTGIRKVIAESDTSIAYEAQYGSSDGLILICGTGSVLYGKHNGSEVRIGGWGRILGDSGSSYSISLNILKRLVKDFDLSDEKHEAENLLAEKYGITRDSIIADVYHRDFDIASLTSDFLGLAANGNGLCVNAVNGEITEIRELLEVFFGRYATAGPVDLAFTGSLAETKNYFSEKLFAMIDAEFVNRVNIIKDFKSPLEGALKIASRRIS